MSSPKEESVDGSSPTEMVTGEFIPEKTPRADENPGDATAEFVPPPRKASESAGEATGAYRAEKPSPGDATQQFTSEPAADDAASEFEVGRPAEGAQPLTNIQVGRGEATQAASVGAFPSAKPRVQSGRYFLKKVAGRGGMGEVWLAEDSVIGRPVALKKMRRAATHELRERFLLEAQITGQLEHPGVIPVHELGVDEAEQPYYVMKFVQGRTLKAAIAEYHGTRRDGGKKETLESEAPEQSTPPVPREVQWLNLLNIFIDLCQTVAYAHSRGVIHRDIKPDNVMVGSFGETIVLDWGLAKVVGEPESVDPFAQVRPSHWDESLETMAGSIKGTPFYMAPEVAEGRVADVDETSDVYLLGGCLYQILTGKPPRQADKVTEMIQLARKTPPLAPRKINAKVPRALDAICQKSLAMNKKDRYSSAASLAQDVQRYLAGEPVTAYRETFLERAWRWAKKHRRMLSRAALALVLLGIGVTAFAIIRSHQEEAEAARRKTAELEARAQAQTDLEKFRRLVDETNFYAANADPMEETAPFFDVKKGEAKGQEALALAARWGPDLAALPLADEHDKVKAELRDLVLLLAQAKSRFQDAASANEVLALVARAAQSGSPTMSFHRLRSIGYRLTGNDDKAEEEEILMADAELATTAMDHFLLAEQLRRDSARSGQIPIPTTAKGGKEGRARNWEVRRDLLEKAMAQYRLALAKDPTSYWCHFQLAKCYMALGQDSEAAEAFSACIALRPQTPWALSSRGLALGRLQRFDEALADLNKAIAVDPDSRIAYLGRGNVYNDIARLHKDRAETDTAQKYVGKALADYETVLAPPDDKQLAQALFFRGQLQLAFHDYQSAGADFDRLLASKVEAHPVAYLHRARVSLAQGKEERLLQSLASFLGGGAALDPKSPKTYELLGRELRIMGTSELPKEDADIRRKTFRLALTQLEKALAMGGKSVTLYGEIGALEELLAGLNPKEALPRIKEAIAAYTKALDVDPKDVKVRIKRGWVYTSVNLMDNARADFDAALKVDASHAEAHTGSGYSSACLKAGAEARRHANLALLHGAGDQLVLHNTACIFGKLSDTEPARLKENQDLCLDLLQRAVELWVKAGRTGINELDLIRGESAFPEALKDRPEFRRLLEDKP